MRTIINPEDVVLLDGELVLQLSARHLFTTFTDENWHFYKDKRLFVVKGTALIRCNGGDGIHFPNQETFATYFNNPRGKGARYFRLLTAKELKFVESKLLH